MDLEQEIQSLKERNARVETDKAWERSPTRRIFIALVTYVFATIWLYYLNEKSIFLKAVIPTTGYVLSTLSIPQLKKVWIKFTNNTSDK